MDEDDEWEYEYSQTETETFLVDLDLTVLNQHVSPATGKKVSRTLQLGKNQKQTTRSSLSQRGNSQRDTSVAEVQSPEHDDRPNNEAEEEEVQEVDEASASTNSHSQQAMSGHDVQLLDLTTPNPLVSFEGNIYSCMWVDMIGTNMFFMNAEDTPPIAPELTTKDYTLLGTSRIKLVGHQAKVTPLTNAKPVTERGKEPSSNEELRPGASLGDLKNTNPKTNMLIRRQANFLQQLINIKKARGEIDNVRVVSGPKITSAGPLPELQTPAKRKQINELNTLALQGNGEAMRKLRKIYSGLDSVDLNRDQGNENSTPNVPVSSTQMPATRAARSDEDGMAIGLDPPSNPSTTATPNLSMQVEEDPKDPTEPDTG